MEVRSNRIGDVRSYYREKLMKFYPEKEVDTLLFILISEYSGMSRAKILISPEEPVSESQLLKIHFGVKALQNHKPIQYITGKTEFFGLNLAVTPDVLIPRPETEELVDWIIKEQSTGTVKSILDIGTGSGCIAIVLQKHIGDAKVDAIDISEGALAVAQKNAKTHKASVNFRRVDFLNPEEWEILGKYDLIVSNPPYVRHSEKSQMKMNVLNYEPDVSLFVSDEDPLLFYRNISQFCNRHLKKGGSVFCELNQYLAKEIRDLFNSMLQGDAEIRKDIFGKPRFLRFFVDS